MASENGLRQQRTPSSDESAHLPNGFNSPEGNQYYASTPQDNQQIPSSHRDPRRTPRRKRPKEPDPFDSPRDSEGNPLACDLFCGTEGPPRDLQAHMDDVAASMNAPYRTPQLPVNEGHYYGNHRGQNYLGSQKPGAGQQPLGNSASSRGGGGRSQGNHQPARDAHQRSSKSKSHFKDKSSDHRQPASDRGQRSSANSDDGNLNESSNKSKTNSKNPQNFERKVQYVEDPLDSEFANLKITVTEKTKPKKLPKSAKKTNKGEPSRKNAESSEKNALSPIKKSGPSSDKVVEETTRAERFVNPLLSPKPGGNDSKSSTPIKSQPERELHDPTESDSIRSDSKLTTESETTSSQSDPKPGKKKKKKKKNRSKSQSNEVNTETSNASDGAPSKPPENLEKDDTETDETYVTATDGSFMSQPSIAKEVKGEDKQEKKVTPSDQKVKKSYLEEMGLEQAEKRLEKDFISKVEKKPPNHPNALYYCRLCSHHINSIAIAHKHMKEKRHKKEIKAKERDEILLNYEMPPPAALDVLSHLLEDITSKEMLTHDDTEERQKVVQRLNAFVDTKIEACCLVMFGSSLTTVGMKAAEINIEIQYSGEMKVPSMLIKLLSILKDCEFVIDVHEDFDARMPTITVTDQETNLVCVLSVHNSKSVQSTRLIKLYSVLEPKVLQLAKVFRLWGRYCDLDQQLLGSLPPHAFALFAIFYLQQEQQLPVLHEIMAEHDMEAVLLETPGYEEILKIVGGDWWYNPTAPPVGEEAKKSEVEIDEPDETMDLAGESDCDIEITFEASPAEVVEKKERPLIPTKLSPCFKSHTPSIGELWTQMLKFFTAKFDTENLIITIRCQNKVTRSERNWPHRRLAVEDPTSPKHNLCKTVTSQGVFTFYQTQLRTSVIYFLTAHKKREAGSAYFKKTNASVLKSAFDELKDSQSSVTKSSESEMELPDESDAELSKLIGQVIDDVITDVELMGAKVTNEGNLNYEGCYIFARKFLTDGKTPVTICRTCKKEGHQQKDCPDEVTIEIKPLPEFTEEMKSKVDAVTLDCYKIYAPRESEVLARSLVCQEILEFLRKNYNDVVNLCLFGSSRNGFTFRESDLDICLTFSGNETGEGLDFVEIIEDLAKTLRKDVNLCQIIPITTAKVPIVKFFVPRASIEGDISLYNLLAQRNTTMLSLYAMIDERCRILGYAMKAFVKQCGIGDASKGSLSSYAYTLLVIYFLQQRNPPVLPVLQELYEGDKCPEVIVDGWNAWFYEDIKNLDKVWPEFGKNNESVGELWLAMLRYYTEEFDFPRHVIAIKQKKILTAFEKEWTSKFICIEDPFDLSHNLGSAISRKMAKFIRKTFIRARERFGSPPGNKIDKYPKWTDYFFDVNFLTDGQEVPNDRCCRICGRIGHFVKDCPRRRNRKKDDAKMKECFHCGLKGHYRSNCPQLRKAAREGQIPQSHPFDPFLMVVPPPVMLVPPLLRPNMVQRSPVKPQKRPESDNMRRERPQDAETPGKHQNAKERTPKKKNHQSPKPSSKSPYPTGSPQNIGQRQTSNQSYSRSLSDFEYESRRQQNVNPTLPQPSHFDPQRHQAQQNHPTAKHHSLGDSPSPGNMLTVTEIEAKMREDARQQNMSIPRQRSNDQMIPIPNQRQPLFHVRPPHPRIRMQYSVPPMATTPPRHHGQYMPRFPSSPQNQGTPFFSPGDFPHHGDMSGRTPPSPMGPFFPSPGCIRSPQQVGPQRPHHRNDLPGYHGELSNPTGEPIHGRTFVNSGSNEVRREVHFTNPGRPGYHSYPPGPGQHSDWNRHM